ncbi:MAG: endonuclease III [Chloroflexi bacterium]|nr:endonuclease III [Chloroflexota bacterium]
MRTTGGSNPNSAPAADAVRQLAARIAAVDARLRTLYGVARRRRIDPVSELVATILSQSTTDVQTARSFEALRRRFPAWEQVRDAPVSAIAREIRSSGLSRQKAPRIKRALAAISRARGAIELDFLRRLPLAEARDWLMQLDGVGPKTAAIVLLFALGKPAFPVDTHVHRATRRLGWVPARASAEQAYRLLEPSVPPRAHYRLHINLIRHGRAVCRAARPLCNACALRDLCDTGRAVPRKKPVHA